MTTDCECKMQFEGQLHIPVIKNTFIVVNMEPIVASARRMSLPGSLHLCREGCQGPMDSKRTNSDVSIVVSISRSSCDAEDWTIMSMLSEQSSATSEQPPHVRSSAKAAGSCKPHHKARMDRVIRRVAKMLEDSDMIAKVDIADGSLTIQVHSASDSLTQQVSTLAQTTLLEVTTQSKCIYALGFATPSPFRTHASGFEAALGVMENASRACWHVFKRGFCRHGANCCKQHPVLERPLQVIIESAAANRS